MKRFFENTIVLVSQVIILILSVYWYLQEYETHPLILIIASFTSIIVTLFFKFKKQPDGNGDTTSSIKSKGNHYIISQKNRGEININTEKKNEDNKISQFTNEDIKEISDELDKLYSNSNYRNEIEKLFNVINNKHHLNRNVVKENQIRLDTDILNYFKSNDLAIFNEDGTVDLTIKGGKYEKLFVKKLLKLPGSKNPTAINSLTFSKNDIRVFNYLMSLLNIKQMEYILRDMQNNLPITIDDINMFGKFLHECKSVSNKIINKTLNEYFCKFEDSLRTYWLKRSNYTFGLKNEPELFGFPEDVKSMNYALYEERVEELDNLASESYKNLEKLIEFAKKEDIYNESL